MKLTGIRHIYAILLFLVAAIQSVSAATPTAADILAKTSGEMRKAQSLKASFTVDGNGQRSSGEITIDGNRFYLTTPEMATWFDGKTQWSYSPAAEEVSVSEPTASELEQINPFAIIDGLQKQFKGRRLTAPKGLDRLELTPKNNSDYSKVVLTINSATGLPVEITFTTTDRTVTAIKILSLIKIKTPPASTFRFDPKKYPLAEIIDLR